MDWLLDLLTNRFLITGISSWAVAQVLKTVIHYFIYKKLDITRLFGDGGMPSGHSATVTSIAISAALCYGPGSFEFAVAAILAIIVCHDAMGVRLETQKQNVILKKLLQKPECATDEEIKKIKLKNSVGHTLPEIIGGVIVGIAAAILMNFLLF